MKKASLILASIMSILTLGSCGKTTNTKQNNNPAFEVDKSRIFGMTDLSYQEDGTDYTYTHKLYQNMGVTSVRLWCHANWVLKSPTEYSQSGLEKMKAIYNDLLGNDYQIIGMNHSNFHKTGLPNSSSYTAKPARDLTKGSYYLSWLNDLETTYYNIVKAFPDIALWEIDNECNNDDFMPRIGGGTFTLQEKAEIYYDMMYFASRGIHRANPNAQTIMGGLIVSNAETFLGYIYDLIEGENSWSKNPDDYFQNACWHPYVSIYSKNRFINLNNSIYNVIKSREGKDKKVYLTEMGFSEASGFTKEEIAEYIESMYKVCRDDLYYVESLHYFRMYDDYSTTWGSEAEKTFGLFYDPVDYKSVAQGEIVPKLASPKDGAYAFQRVANGKGSLDTYSNYLDGEYDSKFVMHRGASTLARENTIESFTLAGQNERVFGIETDVYLTKDKKPVLIHDQNTKRVTLGKYDVDVTTSTLEEVRQVKLPDMNGNPGVHLIPTLGEYLSILKQYNKVGFLELKKDFSLEDLEIIFAEIEKEYDLSKMHIISFYPNSLLRLRNMYPNLPISVLYSNYSGVDITYLLKNDFGADIEKGSLDVNAIKALKDSKIATNVWTVDDLEEAKKFGRLDVDYITTNCLSSFKA